MIKILLTLSVSCLLLSGCASNSREDIIPDSDGDYLGQPLPGTEPELFAPGIFNTSMMTRDFAMTPDKKEIYYTASTPNYKYTGLLCTKRVDKGWTQPEILWFARDPDYYYIEPALSPDGEKLFFVTNQPVNPGDKKDESDIWISERTGEVWDTPRNLGYPVNSEASEYFPSAAENGSLYFTRQGKGIKGIQIYSSKIVDGKFQEAEPLPESVNTALNQYNAFVSPDESYIIVPTVGREDSYGGTDYYISFRNMDGSWTRSVNMGAKVNSESRFEYSASVTPDKKYLFFMSTRDNPQTDSASVELTYRKLTELNDSPYNGSAGMYWIDASFIDELKDSTMSIVNKK